MTDNDAPQLARDVTHATIGALLHDMRQTLDALIAIRTREFGELLDGEEGELLQINNSLLWLLSDIKLANDAREATKPKLRIVQNA